MYWAGRDDYSRPGRYFFVVMKVAKLDDVTDSAVADCLARFEGKQPVPLPHSDWGLDAGWQLQLTGQEMKSGPLWSFRQRLKSVSAERHVGFEVKAGRCEFIEFGVQPQDNPMPVRLIAAVPPAPTPAHRVQAGQGSSGGTHPSAAVFIVFVIAIAWLSWQCYDLSREISQLRDRIGDIETENKNHKADLDKKVFSVPGRDGENLSRNAKESQKKDP